MKFKHNKSEIAKYIFMYSGFIAMVGSIIYNLIVN